MKNVFTTPVAQGITRRAGLLTLLGSALALAGCGGGGGDLAVVGSGGTGSFSVGPITGLGSIIVNGVRFEDSGAAVRDDDGVSRNRSELKLGMMATVTGSAVTRSSTDARATASAIVFGGELQGRIAGTPDASLKTFVVLGQTVKVTGSTVFDVSLANGFNSLMTDTIVEVHGMLDPATNTLTATFIERKNSPPALFKIQGLVSSHDGIARFNIGSIRINYSTAADVRVIPTNGTLVRVRLTAVLPPAAAPAEWTATRIRPPENANEDRDEAEIEGSITVFTSPTRFSVNGIVVNASSATFPDGQALAVGVRVEVKGRLSAGVLIAERVKIEDGFEVDNLEFELHGTVSNVTLTSFTLTSSGGVAVNVSYTNALISNLQSGAKVEVKGTVLNAPGASTIIEATRITFE